MKICEMINEIATWDLGGYWITDTGEIEEVDHDSNLHHADIAFYQYFSTDLNIDPTEFNSTEEARNDDFVRDEILKAAENDGWIRVSTRKEAMSITFNPYKTNKSNIKKLINLIKRDQEYNNYVIELGPTHLTTAYETKREAIRRLADLLT